MDRCTWTLVRAPTRRWTVPSGNIGRCCCDGPTAMMPASPARQGDAGESVRAARFRGECATTGAGRKDPGGCRYLVSDRAFPGPWPYRRSPFHGHHAEVQRATRPAQSATRPGYALILSRVVAPASKLATIRWWSDTSLGADLDLAGANTDEVYAAMDWLLARQTTIEKKLAARHLQPGGMALFDLSSTWMEGKACPLTRFGHSRDVPGVP